MTTPMQRLGAAVVLACAAAVAAAGDSGLLVERSVVAGGGGSASGGGYVLDGTIAQPAASVSAGAGHAIHSGFWSAPAGERPDALFRDGFEDSSP